MEVNNEPHQFQWIVNEGLLRDEGTLYGISGADTQDKIEAIRDYYRIRKAVAQTRKNSVNQKIEELKTLGNHPGNPLPVEIATSNLFPILLQLLFYMGICYFNYWLESYWLSPVIHSTPICIGLYLFGLFSVFLGRSIMYNPTQALSKDKDQSVQREKWKIYTEEFGVSLIVSLFISILPMRTYPVEFSIASTMLFFMLFLLGGKGLINTFFRSRKELSIFLQGQRQKKANKTKNKELKSLSADLESAMATLEELNGEEEYKIKVFTSEYKLAYESRQLAAGITMKKFA